MSEEDSGARRAAQTLFWTAGILAFLVPSVLFWIKGRNAIGQMDLAAWGDFLAGVFGPASLLVLGAGFLLQQDELKLQRKEIEKTRETLQDQKIQMEASAKEAKHQNAILYSQNIMNEWNLVDHIAVCELLTLRRILRANSGYVTSGMPNHIVAQRFYEFLFPLYGDELNEIKGLIQAENPPILEMSLERYISIYENFLKKYSDFPEIISIYKSTRQVDLANLFRDLLNDKENEAHPP